MIIKFEADPPERDGNGVRLRMDGSGDAWANEHRQLGKMFYMNDIDAFMGYVAFAKTGDCQLFAEYQPDKYENKGKIIRRYATVALFDRKKSAAGVEAFLNDVQLAYLLDLCRQIGKVQPKPPRFFFVIGEKSPWKMQEVDIVTGELKTPIACENDWRKVWDESGLTADRAVLKSWVESVATKSNG